MKPSLHKPGMLNRLLVCVLLLELLAGMLLQGPLDPWMLSYRLLHLAEMIVLIGLVAWIYPLQSLEARLLFAGLLLSLGGDLVNSFLFDLGDILKPQILLSIPFFAVAHLCYVAMFVQVLRHPADNSRPLPVVAWWVTLCVWPLLALGLWQAIIDPTAPLLLHKLSLGYAFVVTLMGVMALLLGYRLGRRAWLPALGGLSFVLSDCILGCFLLAGPERPLLASQAIWVTYFLAQALISHTPTLRTTA